MLIFPIVSQLIHVPHLCLAGQFTTRISIKLLNIAPSNVALLEASGYFQSVVYFLWVQVSCSQILGFLWTEEHSLVF